MRGALLLRTLSVHARNRHFSLYLRPTPLLSNVNTNFSRKIDSAQPLDYFPSRMRFFSSDDGTQDPDPNEESESFKSPPEEEKASEVEVEGIANEEVKTLINDYKRICKDEVIGKVFESVLKKVLSENDEEIDGELVEELRSSVLGSSKVVDDESDEEGLKTDDDIEEMVTAKETIVRRMKADPFFNIDDRKWDAMMNSATEGGHLQHLKECEDLLDNMQNWEKLLPDEIKQKIMVKYNEINGMIDRGEVSFDEGFELYQKYEDEMVSECKEIATREEKKGPVKVQDDRQGKGPELRWVTRMVLPPGGESWHPKNRKVKLSTTVGEYGLSKYQRMRLRELAGKRYNPGKDELTITSERFEHREENRKDCLRTLIALIEEAQKADKMVHEARVSIMKDRLKANPAFMQRLQSKKEAPSTSVEA